MLIYFENVHANKERKTNPAAIQILQLTSRDRLAVASLVVHLDPVQIDIATIGNTDQQLTCVVERHLTNVLAANTLSLRNLQKMQQTKPHYSNVTHKIQSPRITYRHLLNPSKRATSLRIRLLPVQIEDGQIPVHISKSKKSLPWVECKAKEPVAAVWHIKSMKDANIRIDRLHNIGFTC